MQVVRKSVYVSGEWEYRRPSFSMLQSARVVALEKNLWSHWSQLGRSESCALVDQGGVLRFDTPIAALPYNGVLRFYGGSSAFGRVDEIIAHYERRGVPFFWIVHPTASADLARRLYSAGLRETEVVRGMTAEPRALPAAVAPPDGVVIREIAPADENLVFEFVAWRWDAPADAVPHLRRIFRHANMGVSDRPTRGWIATVDGNPVGKVFTHASDGTVGLYGLAIKPEARGRGIARALCLKALHGAAGPDTRLFVLHSTPVAVGLFRRMNFVDVAPFSFLARGVRRHV